MITNKYGDIVGIQWGYNGYRYVYIYMSHINTKMSERIRFSIAMFDYRNVLTTVEKWGPYELGLT